MQPRTIEEAGPTPQPRNSGGVVNMVGSEQPAAQGPPVAHTPARPPGLPSIAVVKGSPSMP